MLRYREVGLNNTAEGQRLNSLCRRLNFHVIDETQEEDRSCKVSGLVALKQGGKSKLGPV